MTNIQQKARELLAAEYEAGGLAPYVHSYRTDREEAALRAIQSALTAGEGVTIPRELYSFLMGEGEIDGTTFGEMNAKLPGRFWWRALLRTCAPTPPSSGSTGGAG